MVSKSRQIQIANARKTKHEIGDSFTDLPSLEESESANWAPTMTVEGAEYYQVYSQSELWKAKDDTNNVLLGPETIENDVFYYVSALSDYFPLKKDHIDTDGPGLIECQMYWRDGKKWLMSKEFKMKEAGDKYTGNKTSLEELLQKFNRNPRVSQKHGW